MPITTSSIEGKYKYIILGSSWDVYLNAYNDILHRPDVIYKKGIATNLFEKLALYFHFHPRINRLINLPGKDLWANHFITSTFNEDCNLCFIIFYNWICLEIGIIDAIKKRYPTAKIVIIFNDLIAKQKYQFSHRTLDIEHLKKQADLVITYDFNEATKYNISQFNVPYSKPNFDTNLKKSKYDVYFIGQAKDRFDEIMKAFYTLRSYNLRLKFVISNLAPEYKVQDPEITYLDGMGLSYAENIENILYSNCLLEISQKNANGYTLRTYEAIAYGKYIISNNQNLESAPFYNPEFICVTSDFNDIPDKFISGIKSGSQVDYGYVDELSPIKLLDFIEDYLK